MVWCAISRYNIIWLYLFQDGQRKAVKISSDYYIVVSGSCREPCGEWEVLTGTPSDSSGICKAPYLKYKLEIARATFPRMHYQQKDWKRWAPHNSDMSSLDFYWRFLKHNIYSDNCRTISDLTNSHSWFVDNFSRRMQVCLQRTSLHLEHVI